MSKSRQLGQLTGLRIKRSYDLSWLSDAFNHGPQSKKKFLKKLMGEDSGMPRAMSTVSEQLHGLGQREEMFSPISEQGTVTPTYKATTPWPERLYRQRHGTRVLTGGPRPPTEGGRRAWARQGSGMSWLPELLGGSGYHPHRESGTAAYGDITAPEDLAGTGSGYVPKRVPRRISIKEKSWYPRRLSNFNNVMNYWATKNHEAEHAFNQPATTAAEYDSYGRRTSEVGPSIGDLIFRGEQFAREEGKPLQHTVHLPGDVRHDINWMMHQAKKHGYWGKDGQPPRSMDSLIFDNTAGQQWYKRMVQRQEAGEGEDYDRDTPGYYENYAPTGEFKEIIDSNSAVREFMNRFKTPESTQPAAPIELQKQGIERDVIFDLPGQLTGLMRKQSDKAESGGGGVAPWPPVPQNDNSRQPGALPWPPGAPKGMSDVPRPYGKPKHFARPPRVYLKYPLSRNKEFPSIAQLPPDPESGPKREPFWPEWYSPGDSRAPLPTVNVPSWYREGRSRKPPKSSK